MDPLSPIECFCGRVRERRTDVLSLLPVVKGQAPPNAVTGSTTGRSEGASA